KWENEQSYPDITLLAPLARLFDISVDELLAYEKELSVDDVLLLEKDCISIFQTKGLDEGLRYCGVQLKQYPNNLYLKLRLAFVYQQYFHHATSEDIMLEIINKAIELFKAAAKSDDLEVLQAANLGLSSLYMMTERYDESIEALHQLPKAIVDVDLMMSSILLAKGEIQESKKMMQNSSFKELTNLLLNINSLAHTALKEGDSVLALQYANYYKEIIILFELGASHQLNYYLLLADITAHVHDEESTLDALEQLVQQVILCQDDFTHLNSPLFNLVKLTENEISKSTMMFNIKLLLTQTPKFEFIKETPRFEELLKQLS
ncbi:MAG: hypothetical protein ACRCS6_00480, partial [Turicibacter sp.]